MLPGVTYQVSTGDTGLMIRNTILLYEDTEVPGGETHLMEH